MDLGVAYFTGKGVMPDSAIAYAWFYTAARQGVKNAQKNKSALYKKLSTEDKRRAVQLASEFSKEYLP
jgi:TPR repeat protein